MHTARQASSTGELSPVALPCPEHGPDGLHRLAPAELAELLERWEHSRQVLDQLPPDHPATVLLRSLDNGASRLERLWCQHRRGDGHALSEAAAEVARALADDGTGEPDDSAEIAELVGPPPFPGATYVSVLDAWLSPDDFAAYLVALELYADAETRAETHAHAVAALAGLLALALAGLLELLELAPADDHDSTACPVAWRPPPSHLALSASTMTAAPPAPALPVLGSRAALTLAA